MKPLRPLLDLLLYSNFFISLCAAAITVETYLLVYEAVNWLYTGFVFVSTLALYNFPVLISNNFSAGVSARHAWIVKNKLFLIAVFMMASVATLLLLFFFPLKFVFWFAPVAAIAFAYFFPQTQLRSIEGLKAGVVAFIWTSVTAIYPLLLGSDFHLFHSLRGMNGVVVFQNFLFIFPLCVIYNVRDIEADRKAGVRTFPVLYGIKAAIFVCIIFLIAFSALILVSGFGTNIKLAFLLSGAIASALIFFASESRSDYYYSFWVDGMILVQAGLIVCLR